MAKKREWQDIAGFYWRTDFNIGGYLELRRDLAANEAEAEAFFVKAQTILAFILMLLPVDSYSLEMDGKRLRIEYRRTGKNFNFRIVPDSLNSSPINFRI